MPVSRCQGFRWRNGYEAAARGELPMIVVPQKFWFDCETRSNVPISYGVRKYSTGAQMTVATWATELELPDIHDFTVVGAVHPPKALLDGLVGCDEIWAHNAEFDRTICKRQPWYSELAIPDTKWRCSMALARMHGLPGALGKLCEIFKVSVDEAKHKAGKTLIHLFCKPNPEGKYNGRHSHPRQWQEFLEYALSDITSMREIWRMCPKWNATAEEWRLWHLDQRMNERGVQFDIDLATTVMKAVSKKKVQLAAKTLELTNGAVQAATQRDKLLVHIAEAHGITLPDLKADTIERRLNDDNLPEVVKELLRVRIQSSKASTTKYKKVLDTNIAGRLYNLIAYRGAQRTGRMAGRTFQPQNLVRPKYPIKEIEQFILAFKGDYIEMLTDDVMGAAASCLRSLIIARDGYKLLVSDLSSIEGRFLAFLAGEQWKLDVFAAADRGEGPDAYVATYARSFGIDPSEVTEYQRQIGKVMELALGYYGGVGAFLSMVATYRLNLDELAAAAWPTLTVEEKLGGEKRYTTSRRKFGLSCRVWVVCDALVRRWRAAHPAIVQFWHEVEDAVRHAIAYPGKVIQAGKVSIDRKGNWLRVKLPSGRYLCYPSPHTDAENGLAFVGVDAYTKQWGRIHTYSGKLVENFTQAGSADIMTSGLQTADDMDLGPVMTVHDELMCEVPAEAVNSDLLGVGIVGAPHHVDELIECMTRQLAWTTGLPLSAKGFEATRYRK